MDKQAIIGTSGLLLLGHWAGFFHFLQPALLWSLFGTLSQSRVQAGGAAADHPLQAPRWCGSRALVITKRLTLKPASKPCWLDPWLALLMANLG